MLPQALSAPTRSHDAAGTILIGGVLLLFSIAFPLVWLFALTVSPVWVVLAPLVVFPPLLVLGYDLRVMEAGLRESAAAPPFLGWSQLVRDGVRSILLGAVYLLPAMLVAGAAGLVVAGVQMGQLELSERVATAVTGVSSAAAAAFLLLYLGVFLYVRPAALAVFVATGRLRAALSPRRVFHVALSTDYLIGWTTAAAVLVIGLSIAAPLGLLVAGFFLAFYVRAVAYYAYGRGARTRVPELDEGSLGSATLAETSPAGPPASTVTGDQESATDAGAPASASAAAGASSPAAEQSLTATPGTHGPRADRPLTPSWSPQIVPEAGAEVQVGRDVPLPSDRAGPTSNGRAGSTPNGRAESTRNDRDGSMAGDGERPQAERPAGDDGGDDVGDHDGDDPPRAGSEREASETSTRATDSSFEWDAAGK